MSTLSGGITIKSTFAQASATLPGSGSLISAPTKCQFVPQGTGAVADQAQYKHTRRYTLAGSPTALDLTSLLDTDGASFSFALVRSISVIIEDQLDSHKVLMGYATTTTNAWTSLISNPGQVTIEPSTATNQGGFAMTAPNTTGWPVGPSNKLLNFDPGGNTVVIDVEIVGA